MKSLFSLVSLPVFVFLIVLFPNNAHADDYNYLLVEVSSDGLNLQLQRYRPEAENPCESVELYK